MTDTTKHFELRLPERFSLICEMQADGGLRVYIYEIDGLLLSGKDPREVLRILPKTVEFLTRDVSNSEE